MASAGRRTMSPRGRCLKRRPLKVIRGHWSGWAHSRKAGEADRGIQMPPRRITREPRRSAMKTPRPLSSARNVATRSETNAETSWPTFASSRIDGVINKVGIFPGDELAHALHRLSPSDVGKQDKVLQGIDDGRAHAQRGGRIALAYIIGDVDEVLHRARREAQLHRSKRRKAASTSASLANWRRLAWARPSSTAGRCAASISSGSPSLRSEEHTSEL